MHRHKGSSFRRTGWALPLALLVAIISAITLTACGGSHSVSQKPASRPVITPPTATPKAAVVRAKVVNQHVCDIRDYTQNCALPNATVPDIVRGVDPTTQGVDFGWSCPVSVAQSFGASYGSNDPSKDWTRACVNLFHARHKATVDVWEAGANDAQGGFNLGYNAAKKEAGLLSVLGAPKGQPFDMAADCDCAGSSLVGYFQGANNAEPGRINAYGGYYQILYLFVHHLVGHLNWQTYAWSGGLWLPARIAPLEQYLNSSAVDYDRAIAANYGQWPAPATVAVVKPKPKVSYTIYDSTLRHFRHGVVTSERTAAQGWDRAGCRNPVRRPVCRSDRLRIVLLADRLWHVSAAHGIATFGVFRPSTWSVNHRGARYQGLLHRLRQR